MSIIEENIWEIYTFFVVVKLQSKSSQTRSWLCFTHVTTRTSTKIYQKEVYYRLEIWHRDLTHKIKTRWSAMDGQPPSPGWSPTIQNLPERGVLQTWTLAHIHYSQNQDQVKCHGWSATIPRMVTHHPKDGRPPSKINQKELYYRLGIWYLGLTNKI